MHRSSLALLLESLVQCPPLRTGLFLLVRGLSLSRHACPVVAWGGGPQGEADCHGGAGVTPSLCLCPHFLVSRVSNRGGSTAAKRNLKEVYATNGYGVFQ